MADDLLKQSHAVESSLASWRDAQAKLEQRFEEGFEKLYKLLGLPFEKDDGTWSSSHSILLNDQIMEENDESIQRTPFIEVAKKGVELEGTPTVRSIASECKPMEEVKPDEVIDEGLVLIDSEKFTKEAWEAVAYALEMAASMQQKVETEHLMRALLEQKQGLVSRVLNEVSIDIALLLKITNEFIQCPPKNIGEENGSVIGRELAALLQRAMEWKEEYGDFLLSTEHLLLGFNLDNRIGKQLYKEGNAFDISFKILDAIEVMKKSQVFMTKEESCEVLKNYIGEENQECIDYWVMEVSKFNEGGEVLNENSFAITNLIDCDDSFSKTVIAGSYKGANICLWKSFVAHEGKHNWLGYLLAKLNTIQLRSNALSVFDEMLEREQLLCKAMVLNFLQDQKIDSTLGLMKKEKNWITLPILIQSKGPNVVELLDKIMNASNGFSTVSVDLVGVFLKGLDEGSWVHSFLDEEESDYDVVIGTTMEGVKAFKVINAENKDILGLIPMAASYYQKGKVLHYSNQLENSRNKLNQGSVQVYDPGGS
ncbi:hypothetical protein LguiB_009934 [Lonicera macranthoides]